MNDLKKYKLTRVDPTDHNSDTTVDVVELKVEDLARYVFYIDVGSLPTREAQEYLVRARAAFKGFMPEGHIMFVPTRNGVPSVQIAKLERFE